MAARKKLVLAISACWLALVSSSSRSDDQVPPSTTGSLARDRINNGLIRMAEPVAVGISDASASYVKYRSASDRSKNPIAFSATVANYQRDVARNGFEMSVAKGSLLFVEVPLSMGGPVGIAASGVFHAAMSRVVENAYAEKNSKLSTLLQQAMRNTSDDEFSKLFSEIQSNQRTERFKQFVDRALAERANGDATVKEGVENIMFSMLTRMGQEQARQQQKLAKDSQANSVQLDEALQGIQDIDDGIGTLNDSVGAISDQMKDVQVTLARQADEAGYDKLGSAQEQEEYLRRGGLAHMDPTKRQQLYDKVATTARFEPIQKGLATTGQALNAFAKFARLVKDPQAAAAIERVSQGVQAAQAAVSIAAAFSGVGSPFAALQAVGGLGDLFGGSSDPMGDIRADLQEIKTTLKEMNEKLDRIMDMQMATLDSLEKLHAKVDLIQRTADKGFNDIQRTLLADVFAGCRTLMVAPAFGGGLQNLDVPFQDAGDFRRYQFITTAGLRVLRGSEMGTNCWSGLDQILVPGSSIPLTDDIENKESERQGQEEWKEIRTELVSQLSMRLETGKDEERVARWNDVAFWFTRPARSLSNLRAKLQLLKGITEDNRPLDTVVQRPCWWRTSDEPTRCGWSQRDFSATNRQLLMNGPRASAMNVALLSDMVLSFYPVPLLPRPEDVFDQKQQRVSSSRLTDFVDKQLPVMKDDLARILENSIIRLEASVAHEAMMDGELLSAMLAKDLLNPPIAWDGGETVNKLTSEARDNRLPAECLTKWGERPAGVAAAANAFLFDNPRIAHLALRTLLHELIFQDPLGPSFSPRSAQYDYAVEHEPIGEAFRLRNEAQPAEIEIRKGTRVLSGDNTHVQNWWRPLIELASIDDKARNVRFVHRGFDLHYSAVDATSAKLWKVGRGVEGKPDSCGGYHMEAVDVTLPKGWSVSAGGVVMRLPKSAPLYFGAIEYGPRLNAVQNRANLMRHELASVVAPTTAGLGDAMDYGIASQAVLYLKSRNLLKELEE